MSVFQSAQWLDVIAGEDQWDVILIKDKGGAIKAAWPYVASKKLGIKKLGQAILTPHIGPFLVYPLNQDKQERRYSFEVNVCKELIKACQDYKVVKQSFNPIFNNWMSFHWAGYRQSTRYTYVLEDLSNADHMWKALKSSVKNDIRTAKDRYTIREERVVSNLYQLNQSTFERKGQKTPFSEELLANIFDKIDSKILTVFEEETPVVSVMNIYDKQKAYCLLVGVNKDLLPRGAVQWALWESILASAKKVNQYDFEGSMIPEVESVFRAFGGKLTPFFTLSKAPNWFRMLYQLRRGKSFSL